MKKRVNRLIAALFATVVAVSPLVGCGAENTDSGILELNVFNAEEYISEFDADWETTDIIEDFEAYATEKYGRKVKVNYSTFGTLENMYNELQLTKKKGKNGYTYAYDLVCPSDYMIQRMINEDMLETYDVNYDEDGNVSYTTIDNFNDYASGFIKDLFNSKEEADYVTGTVKKWSEYAVCYMWGTMGFIYNPVKLAETNANIDINTIVDEKGELKLSGEELENAVNANTWHLPWEAYYKNLGTIKDSIRDTYALAVGNVYSKELLALRALWENGTLTQPEYQSVLIKVFNNVNTVFSDEFAELKLPADKLAAVQKIFPDAKEKTVDKVSETLKVLKHNVYGFEVDSGKKDMAAGKIAINFAWSGDAAYTLDTADEYSDGAKLYYAVPKEGSNIWFDAWVMPKGANKELAQDFVNFISSPENAISNMDYIGYVSPIAGDDVFARLLDTYELTTDPDEAEELGYTAIDYSYYFDNISDEYETEDEDGNAVTIKFRTDDGKVIVYASPDMVGRQLTTQYPEKSTVDRCALMTTLSKQELKDINRMWSDVKVGDIPTSMLIIIPVIIGLLVIGFVAYSILKKHGITLKRKPKNYGTLIKSERI